VFCFAFATGFFALWATSVELSIDNSQIKMVELTRDDRNFNMANTIYLADPNKNLTQPAAPVVYNKLANLLNLRLTVSLKSIQSHVKTYRLMIIGSAAINVFL
jgi:hypothetical protein